LFTVSDSNLGLSFGNPVVTKRSYDGRWVVLLTSGYNNTTGTGTGVGMGWLYELDPFKGTILGKVSTGAGSSTTPSGLARISALASNPDTDNTSRYVYGGDLLGNLWRFDLSGSSPTVSAMATLVDASGKPQSITTRPELGQVNNSTVVYVGTGRLLGVTDLQDPATLSPAGNWSYVSSLYALVDNGTSLGNPRANSSLVVQTLSSYGGSSVQRTVSSNPVNIPSNIGWMVDFPSTGERVNIDPQLALGTVVVTTNVPNSSACTAGGDSWVYQFGYGTGSAIAGVPNNIAGSKMGGAMTVGNVLVQLPSQAVKIISTESSGTKVTSGLDTNAVNPIVRRVGWREVPQ
jgi:type IV pilus assembly protein PilY1